MNLRITFKYEGKLHRTDSPLFEPPAMDATPEHFTTYQDLLVEQDNVVLLILTCMIPELQKEMKNCNAYDMNNELKNMFQTQASQELYDTQRLLNASKMEEDYMLQEFSGSDDILDEIHDNPIEPQTKNLLQDLLYNVSLNLEGRDLRDHDEPDTYHQAMTCSESRKWLEAMNAEMDNSLTQQWEHFFTSSGNSFALIVAK
nr:hypothetical protein [Tanacetum cinerariifolium]